MTQTGLSLEQRVQLTRLRRFFEHAIGNAFRVCLGAVLIAVILWVGGTAPYIIGIWFTAVVLVCLTVIALVRAFHDAASTVTDEASWIIRRTALGVAIGLLYGGAPYLLPFDAPWEYVAVIFLAGMTAVAIAAMTYPVMPKYYIVLNIATIVPWTFYFLLRFDLVGQVMLGGTIVWQFAFIHRALDISRAAVEAITDHEKLNDEVAEHQRARDQIHYLAFHDSLTGLANRRQFQENAARTLKVAARAGTRIGVAVIDLDHFKPINDSFGHQMGDRVLREVAARLRHSTRESDLVARLGGDEFGILIENVANPNDVAEVARKIETTLNAPLVQDGQSIPLHASVGFALFPTDGNDLDTVFRIADERMYFNKHRRTEGVSIH